MSEEPKKSYYAIIAGMEDCMNINGFNLYENAKSKNGIKSKYSDWVRRSIKAFDLKDGIDYEFEETSTERKGTKRKDYYFTKESAFLIEQRSSISARIGLKNRKEIVFFSHLQGILENIPELYWLTKKMLQQYPVLDVRVDCYFPAARLVVEYDENYHNSKAQQEKDKVRESKIKEELCSRVIRVKEGFEEKGIGAVLNFFIEEI